MQLPLLIFIGILSLESFALSPSNDLAKGDLLYAKREKIENAYQALWRASMSNYYIGHLTENKEKRVVYYKEGIQQGNKCVKYSSKKLVECYFWLATNTALLKKENGVLSMVFGIGSIINTYEQALAIDPKYAGSGAYRMLSLLHYKAPGFLGGDVKKAYVYIQKAIQQSPHEALNYFFYIKFLNEDKQRNKALMVASQYLSKVDPKKIEQYESNNAYKKILIFLRTKTLPE